MVNKTKAVATISKAGPHTLVVDAGRTQCQAFGLCPGGAADMYAYRWLNKLLGNASGTPALEITLGPFSLLFHQDVCAAITGAQSKVTLNEKPIPPWSEFAAKSGDRLRLAAGKSGLRTYLSFKGSWNLSKRFNSCQRINHDGSAQLFKNGEVLELTLPEHKPCARLKQMTPWWLIPDYDETLTLHLQPGYQFDRFQQQQIMRLSQSTYTLSAQSNRMGYRLQGAALEWQEPGIVSEGIAYGSVQVPPDGQPIVLLNDRQTIGGYPKLGCIKAEDCYQLSQRRPGQKVRFVIGD